MVITSLDNYKTNAELDEADLKHLKEWFSKQHHLPQNVSDELLILIMHSCYYSLELSKQTVDNYFTLRTIITDFFTNREYPKLQELRDVIDTCYAIPFEETTKEGYRVLLMSLKRTEPHFFHFTNSFKMFNMLIDAILQTHGMFPGFIICVDFKGLRLGHLPRLTLPTMKKILVYLQEATPLRLKGLHFINVVPFIDKVVALMKPFMKKELMDLLKLHPEGSEEIYDLIPKEIFPNEYGGKAGELSKLEENVKKLLEDMTPWYREDEKMRVDETKRSGKSKSAGELFGVDGSFKKLTID